MNYLLYETNKTGVRKRLKNLSFYIIYLFLFLVTKSVIYLYIFIDRKNLIIEQIIYIINSDSALRAKYAKYIVFNLELSC